MCLVNEMYNLDMQWEAMINANLDLTVRNIDTQLLSLQEVSNFKILSKSTVKYFNSPITFSQFTLKSVFHLKRRRLLKYIIIYRYCSGLITFNCFNINRKSIYMGTWITGTTWSAWKWNKTDPRCYLVEVY